MCSLQIIMKLALNSNFVLYQHKIIHQSLSSNYCHLPLSLQVQTTTMCISVSLSGFVVLGCMFAPKVHIIMFQPQKNVTSHRLNLNRFSVSGAATTYASHGRLHAVLFFIITATVKWISKLNIQRLTLCSAFTIVFQFCRTATKT